MPKEIKVSLYARLSEVRSMAALIESFGEANELPMRTTFVINLAAEELITNTVIHGRFNGVDDEPRITVNLGIRGKVAALVMETGGDRFDPTMDTHPDTESDLETREVGGLGLHFVKTLADRVSYDYEDGLNRLVLEYDLP